VANTVGLPSYGVSIFEECSHICRRIRIYADMFVSSLFRLYSFVVVLHTEQLANNAHTDTSTHKNERIRILRHRISFGSGNEHNKKGLACKINSGTRTAAS